MDAKDLLQVIREKNPGRQFAISRDGLVIGVFVPVLARFAIAFAKTLDGIWYHIPSEILVNGAPPIVDWIERERICPLAYAR